MIKFLICDKIHPSAIKFLKQNKLNYNYNPDITAEELKSTVNKYDGLLVRSRTKINSEIIGNGKKLVIVARVGSGVDNIDMEAARSKKLTVINAPDGNTQAVAEMTLALMICLLRKLNRAFESMKAGLWEKKELTGSELNGKTVGIVGYGHIGRKVAEFVKALGAKIVYFSRKEKSCDLDTIFSVSDLLSVHLVLTPKTRGLISASLFAKMKPTAYFLNIARGEIVDTDALYDLLSQRKIAGAALDVFSDEPLPPDSRWRKLPNVILTPHIGAATGEALEKSSMTVVQDIVRFAEGEKLLNSV